jgi:DNA-binding transcriptional ArsR family regulator
MDRFLALSDPTRRRIVEMLGSGALAAGEISARFSVSAPAISQHLKVLREAGLVTVEVSGQRRIYRLDPAGLDEFDAWVRKVRGFWAPHLDLLEERLAKAAADDNKAAATDDETDGASDDSGDK